MNSARFRDSIVLIGSLLVAGCAALEAPSIPAGASMGDVQAKLGKPKQVISQPDGQTVWQYPTGPYGQKTYIAVFGSDQRAKSVTQVLTWENLGKIHRGMTRDEIRLLYGEPNTIITYKNLGEEVWSYRYNIPINDDRIYNVHFDVTSGTVRQTTDSIDELRHPISAGDGGASQ